MYDITRFSLREMTECGAVLRKLGDDAACLEEVAGRVVSHLHENLGGGERARACALVRFYKTHEFEALPEDLRRFAAAQLEGTPPPGLRCLTLLATAGARPEWNSRAASRGHQAIPLTSVQMVRQAPMVATLVTQLGLAIEDVVKPNPDPDFLLELGRRSYDVFHVPVASGSPYIPAQADFVAPFGIRSVLGLGGVLPSGHLFAVILFSTAAISRETAAAFKPLSLAVKFAVLPFEGAVFRAAEHT